VLVHGVSRLPPGAAAYLRTTGTPFSRRTAQLRADAEALLHQALLDTGGDAAMLVVGSRGLGPMPQLLLGSVGQAVAAHATSPVVVVRPHQGEDRDSGIVIGVTGDERDPPVVDFGFRLAATRGLPVTLVHCFWDRPGPPDGTGGIPSGEPEQDDRHAILSEAARGPAQRHASVPVRFLLNRGFADVQLIKASRHAELVLLGHRHKPLLRELVYGSLAPRVVENAACPVAVVPLAQSADQPRDDPDPAAG
jgi:nucleotide-binding universal stress UspA family protein